MTKEQRLIKELTTKVNDLEALCKEKDTSLKYSQKECDKLKVELNDLHSTFDLLAVPSRVKGTYNDLSANARLTLFMAMRNNIKVTQPSSEDQI